MKFLRSPAFWVVMALIAIIATATAGILFLRSDALRGRVAGFLEKSIELWKETEEDPTDQAIEEARKWTDSQVSAAVHRYVFGGASGRSRHEVARVLESLGSRTHPALLKILRDESVRPLLLTPTQDRTPETPFVRACELLEEEPPAEAAEVLSPFLDDPSDEIRKNTAIVLGAIGSPEVVASLRKALGDSDDYVRSYALIGLGRARKHRRLSEACAQAVYGDIERLFLDGKNCDNAAPLILAMDRQRATDLFLSDAVFTPAAPGLHEALRAMAEEGIAVPRHRLLSLIASLEESELKYPIDYALHETLHLLGRHKAPEDSAFLEERMSSPDEEVAAGAAAGMISLAGLEKFDDPLWDAEASKGMARLPAAHRHYLAVMICDGEVNNGGWSQYFGNSSGNDWRDALAGFEAMGSVERLAVLRAALAKFGKRGPSRDLDQRTDQLVKLEEANDKVFDDLDRRYYDSKEVIEVLTARYVLKNAEAFRAKPGEDRRPR